jgi:hypothetical protein
MSIHQDRVGVGSIEGGKLPEYWRPLRRTLRFHWLALALSLPLVAIGVQRWVMTRAVGTAVATLGWLATPMAPEEPPSLEIPPDAAGSLLGPLEEGQGSGKAGPSRARRSLALSRSVRVSAATVEQWIRARSVPRGRSVPANATLPAGIEIIGAGAFGLGLGDRDRLVSVEGRSVSAPGEVFEAVLAALGRRAPTLNAVFYRNSPAGVVSTTLLIELPDLAQLNLEDGSPQAE